MMVLIDSTKETHDAALNCELKMRSGRCVHYVAPAYAVPSAENNNDDAEAVDLEPLSVIRKKNTYTGNDPEDFWEGVSALCRSMDDVLEHESDDIIDGKNVLEIGFCTGVPSVFAFANGAAHLTLHCEDKEMLDSYIKPTLARNKVKSSQRKFVFGDLENLKKTIKEKHYDVVLAPEFTNTDRSEFEALHDLIDHALAPDGICLLSARMYYFNNDGSLPEFLDLVKYRGKFETYTRWTSSKADVVQRKTIQLTRTIR